MKRGENQRQFGLLSQVRRHGTEPATSRPLSDAQLVPNRALFGLIASWLAAAAQRTQQPGGCKRITDFYGPQRAGEGEEAQSSVRSPEQREGLTSDDSGQRATGTDGWQRQRTRRRRAAAAHSSSGPEQ